MATEYQGGDRENIETMPASTISIKNWQLF